MSPIQNRYTVLAYVCLVIALLRATAAGQTITVDISDPDAIDIDPETATVSDLPGPDGHISFSEAMIASNNTPGRQTVGFAIPVSEWTYLPLIYTGRVVINGMMFYANAIDAVTIDGTTQTAFTGDTNPNGGEVVIQRGGGLWLPADGCIIRGLDLANIYIDGTVNTIDLTIFLSHFGETVSPGTLGDLNSDGIVNTQDLTRFLSGFGQPCL